MSRYAKTLYKPEEPKNVKKMIKKYTKKKLPYFFTYAKDKEIKKVEELNNSIVNRLGKIIKNPRIRFDVKNLKKFKYSKLLYDYKNIYNAKKDGLYDEIIDTFNERNRSKHFLFSMSDEDLNNISYTYKKIRKDLLDICPNICILTDVLVYHQYVILNTKRKDTLWICFGDILLENLKRNIDKPLDGGYIMCEACGERIEVKGKNQKMCKSCWHEKEKKIKRDWWSKR